MSDREEPSYASIQECLPTLALGLLLVRGQKRWGKTSQADTIMIYESLEKSFRNITIRRPSLLHPTIKSYFKRSSSKLSYITMSSARGVNPDTFAIINADEAGPALIPKIIHQTWKDEHIPPEWQAAQQSCLDLHPGYEYKLWTDESSRAFIADKFPNLLATWDAYPFVIQRADVIRYAVLQEFGGFYIDLDIECLRPLDFLRRYPFVMPQTRPVGFSNDFIAAEPGNAFVKAMVLALPRWRVNLAFKYPTVMFSTGPMFVTLKASLYGDKRSLWVLPDDVYNKYVEGVRPLFFHLHGSSWHGDDAKSVLWIVHHPFFLAILTLTGIVGALAFSWRKFHGRRGFGVRKEEVTYSPLVEISYVKDS